MKNLFCIFIVLLLAACSSKNNANELNKFSGLWQTNNSETDLYEEWSKPHNNIMYGKSYAMNGKDSIVSVRMELKKQGEDLFYIPTVTGENDSKPVTFKMIFSTDTSYTFENKQIKFPQRITYKFIGKDSLTAKIEGIENGEQRYQEFFYHRVTTKP